MTTRGDEARLTADRWEVVLQVPVDVADFGLHANQAEAAARFRRQLADGIGAEAAREHGPAAERDFVLQRAALEESAAIWAGYVVTSTIDMASLAEQASDAAAQQAEGDVVMVALLVAITELPTLSDDGVISPAAAISRLLKNRYGEEASTHVLDYDGRPAAAAVRVEELELAGVEIGGHKFPDDTPAAEHLLAEVHVLFPEAGALATVTGATLHPPSLNHAVLLAGSIAQTVRVRSAE